MRGCGLVTHGSSGAGDVFSQRVLDRTTIACVRDRIESAAGGDCSLEATSEWPPPAATRRLYGRACVRAGPTSQPGPTRRNGGKVV